MTTTTKSLLLSIALALTGCCGAGSTTTAPVPTGSAPVAPVAPPVGAAQTLTIGAPPATVAVPALPGVSLTVPAGEFQIDVRGGAMDAQASLYANGSLVTSDSDSGEGVDARIVTFLDPGTYEIHVGEWQQRDLDAQVQVTQLAPLVPVASIAPGAPPTVVMTPAGDAPRAASVELALTIAAPGSYRIDVVSPDGSVDPEVQLIQSGALVQSDSDSGDGTNAQIVRQLAPGAYAIRVRDWMNRAASLTVTVTPG